MSSSKDQSHDYVLLVASSSAFVFRLLLTMILNIQYVVDFGFDASFFSIFFWPFSCKKGCLYKIRQKTEIRNSESGNQKSETCSQLQTRKLSKELVWSSAKQAFFKWSAISHCKYFIMATSLSNLQQSYNAGGEGLVAEDVLHEVLQTLSKMPCPPDLDIKHFLTWTANTISPNVSESQSHDSSKTRNAAESCGEEWTCGILLLKSLLGLAEDEQEHLLPLIPPHVIVQCTVERYIGSVHYGGSARVTMFQVVCILALSIAMKNCATVKHQRWGRVQSLCMESIALFQKMFLNESDGENDDERDLFIDESQIISMLYCKHLSPALRGVFQAMEEAKDTPRGPDGYKCKAIAAGMVNVASSIAFLIAEANSSSQCNDDIVADLDLVNDIITMPTLEQAFIWGHPLFLKTYDLNFDDQSDEDDAFEAEMQLEREIFRELTPLLCRDVHDLGLEFDMLCGMRVKWEEEALGVMLHTVIFSKLLDKIISDIAETSKLFKLIFPFVSILLGLSQRNSIESSDNTTKHVVARREFFATRAFEIIDFLLKNIDDDCILEQDIAIEVSPVGTIQLLLNHAVNISSAAEISKDSLTPKDVIALVRKILSVYPFQIQLNGIGILLRRCPFPFLVPMLIDLARQPVSNQSLSEIKDTMEIIAPFLEEIKACFPSPQNDCAIAVDRLIENTEMYTSTVSLFRLLYLRILSIGNDSESKEMISHVMHDMNAMHLSLVQLAGTLLDGSEAEGSDGKMSFRLYLLLGAFSDLMTAASTSIAL